MALALRFAEEGEFTSRAVDASYDDVESAAVAPSPVGIFRWSKAARTRLGLRSDGDAAPLPVARLLVATRGAPQRFLEQLTASWSLVATLVVSDESPTSTTLDARHRPASTQLLSFEPVDHADFGKHVAVVVPNDISSDAVWSWTQTLQRHVQASETLVLDAQLSSIYDFGFGADDAPMLRTLASAAARDDKLERLVPTLETPRFVAGVPAALLTQGELRRTRVRAFISLRSANALLVETVRSFSPLVSLLDLPADLSLPSRQQEELDFNSLYT